MLEADRSDHAAAGIRVTCTVSENINVAFYQNAVPIIRDLAVEMKNGGIVLLTGRAGSYHLKQLAQHGILDVLPHVQLVNAIEVWN